ncbi:MULTISPECIES: triose-phosphate isomerase [unclassified Moraxella]|uniref:triose-phosphate isomerase n=1 Tax=unclassified Moraxella TaxID=2685852 RepID=UPI003AF84959
MSHPTTLLTYPTAWLVANWKMNPTHPKEAQDLLHALSALLLKTQSTTELQTEPTCHQQIVLAPSFLHLPQVLDWVATDMPQYQPAISVASQNLCAYDANKGAYTGEVSAQQLADIGVEWVIIGHSERRQYFMEDNDCLAQKIQCALQAGLKVIFCIGETEAQYEAQQTQTVLAEQLAVLSQFTEQLSQSVNQAPQLLVAYEPVWAIGTGKVPTTDEVQHIHAFIRQQLASYHPNLAQTAILYGGSVKADNAKDFAQYPDVSGVLVGGASLNAESFYQIINAFGSK